MSLDEAHVSQPFDYTLDAIEFRMAGGIRTFRSRAVGGRICPQCGRSSEMPVVGLFLNTVRAARHAHTELLAGLHESSTDSDNVLVLTGSMRGIERDVIVKQGQHNSGGASRNLSLSLAGRG